MLTVPRYRTKWGSRAFAVAAPSTWNSPPPPNFLEIRRPNDDLSFDIELISILILGLWAHIFEDLGNIAILQYDIRVLHCKINVIMLLIRILHQHGSMWDFGSQCCIMMLRYATLCSVTGIYIGFIITKYCILNTVCDIIMVLHDFELWEQYVTL